MEKNLHVQIAKYAIHLRRMTKLIGLESRGSRQFLVCTQERQEETDQYQNVSYVRLQ